MGTISSAFNIMSQALDADQSALNIVANNVANANTTGYTREQPRWQENQQITINGIAYGTGVAETGAVSQRDRVLEQRLNQQQQLAAASGTRLTALQSVESLFPPDSGSANLTAGDIGSDVTGFFNSFAALEANSTSNALRQQVLSSATTLASDISGVATNLNAQRAALDQQASSIAGQVNVLTSAIAQLNLQIEANFPNSDAGILEDQRQQDISQLSQLIGINQITTENNGISVTTTSGQLLVSEGTSYQMTTGKVNGVTHFFVGTNDLTAQLVSGGGQLGGYLAVRDQDIPNVLSSLDTLAFNLATQVNALNNSGINMYGVMGAAASPLYIFSQPVQATGSALAMSVVMTDLNQIAAASVGQGTGDNSNAVSIADLAKQQIIGGQTPSNFYSSFVSQLGSTISAVLTQNTAQNASATQLQAQRDALSGVNLNDEASTMTTIERSYQAAAQVFGMLNNIMAAALNLGEQTAVS